MSGKNEFKDWFEQFDKDRRASKSHYGSYFTKPKDIDRWIDSLSRNHDELRNRLGGERKDFSLRLGPVEPNVSEMDYTVSGAIYEITYALPEYLKTYNLDRNDLFKEKLSKFKNIKTSKHIMGYITRQKITDRTIIQRVEKSLAIIGDARAKTVTNGYTDINVVISTQPKAFSLIGHFGCDPGSCFAHGNFNDYKRWCFSIMPNTFVLLVKRCATETEEPFAQDSKDPKKPVFRMLGFTNDDFTIFNVCSTCRTYNQDEIMSYGVLREAAKRVAKKIIRAKSIGSVSNNVCLTGNVYGHHPSWSFFNQKKHEKGIDAQSLECKMCEYTK